MSAVGRRYAMALLELAEEQGQTQKVRRDIEALASAFGESAELRGAMTNPWYNDEQREGILQQLSMRLGTSPIVKNTLGVLKDRQRLGDLPAIAEAYVRLAQERTGTILAEVTTAGPMGDAYFMRLKQTLEQATGKKVEIEKKQDAALIAGVVTKVGDKVYDGSLRARLKEMEEKMLTAEA